MVQTLKGSTLCRNQLKRIQKMAFTSEQGEEFERAWLLLANIHIQGGKFDLAQASLPVAQCWTWAWRPAAMMFGRYTGRHCCCGSTLSFTAAAAAGCSVLNHHQAFSDA